MTETDWDLEPVLNWLFTEGRLLPDFDRLVKGLADRLVAHHAPVARLRVGMRTIHPLVTAISVTWRQDQEAAPTNMSSHGLYNRPTFVGSPMQIIAETEAPYRHRFDRPLPPDAHGALHDLQAEGITDYYGLPMRFAHGGGGLMLVGTKRSGGFSAADLAKFDRLAAAFAPVWETFRLSHLSSAVTEAYLGRRSAQRVLSGEITRGHVEEIDAAILISDLRGWTTLNTERPAGEALALVNSYYDLLDAAILAEDGEILKFMGDGVLAVFPGSEAKAVCGQALRAAQSALAACPEEFRFGVALHHGRVQFGNIGAEARLDFTVMGHAVNYAARLEPLTKEVEPPLVMSDTVAGHVDVGTVLLSEVALKGVQGVQRIYGLASAD